MGFLVFFHFLPSTPGLGSLLPAPQLCWVCTRDGGGGISTFSMKLAPKNTHTVRMETQPPLAFVEYMWQLQSQRISRSNRAYGCLWSRHQFPTLLPPSPHACKMQNSWMWVGWDENSFFGSGSWPVASLFLQTAQLLLAFQCNEVTGSFSAAWPCVWGGISLHRCGAKMKCLVLAILLSHLWVIQLLFANTWL